MEDQLGVDKYMGRFQVVLHDRVPDHDTRTMIYNCAWEAVNSALKDHPPLGKANISVACDLCLNGNYIDSNFCSKCGRPSKR